MPQPKIDVDKINSDKVNKEALKKALKDREKSLRNNELIKK
jgi:hypothetical protein